MAKDLISQLEEEQGDVVLRINTPGGSVLAGWGIIAKMQERKKLGYKTEVKLDGAAMSMGAVILAFAENVEALDVSTVMIHKASIFMPTPEEKTYLDTINQSLYKQLKGKINDDMLKQLKGKSLKDIFDNSTEDVLDVFLTAAEAKKIGLVDSITKMKHEDAKAIADRLYNIAAVASDKTDKTNLNISTMKLEDLKANNPHLYNEIVATAKSEGEKAGVEKERKRVNALVKLMDADKEKALKMITEGADLDMESIAEFTMKKITVKKEEELTAEGDKTKKLAVAEVETKVKTEKDKEAEAFMADVNKELGIKEVK